MLEQVHQAVQTPIFEPLSGPKELMDFAPPTLTAITDLPQCTDTVEAMPEKRRASRNSSNAFVNVLPIAPPEADMAAYSAILAAAMSASGNPQIIETKHGQTKNQNTPASEAQTSPLTLKAMVLEFLSSISSSTAKCLERARKSIAN